jgi:protein-tyrosine phosphatase
MAEVLFRDRLAAAGIDAVVTSAGDLPGGSPASPGSVKAMAARGLDLQRHVSQTLTPELVERADLIIAMGRRHLRSAVAMHPAAFTRTFTAKELVRRAIPVGARRPGQTLGDWLAAVHQGRTLTGLHGDDTTDDVVDPIGRPDREYEATAVELTDLIDHIVDVAFERASTANQETA